MPPKSEIPAGRKSKLKLNPRSRASLITLIASYVKLKNQGLTSWDRDGRFAIIHERIGAPRVVVAILLLVAFSFIAALGRMAQIHAS